MLRIGRPLGLDLGDLVRCQLVSREFARLTLAHATHLDLPPTAALHSSWWQPVGLVSVQTAALQHAAMPAVARLAQLRSLQLAVDPGREPLDLQSLSTLQRLQELQVTGGTSSNAEHLPLLRSLAFSPEGASLRALQRQTLLTTLTLHADGGGGCKGGTSGAAACQGVASLSQLRSLTLCSMLVSSMGGAQALAPCTSLTRLALGFGSACDCCDPSEDLASCGLAPLTQLREVCLRGMAHVRQLDALQLGSLPALERLVLLAPQPCSGDGFLAMPMPVLEVQLDGGSWHAVVSLLGRLVAVQRAARHHCQACFTVLQLSGWRTSPSPAKSRSEAYIRILLGTLVSWGVRVESGGFDLPAEVLAAPASPSDSDSGSEFV